MSIPRMLMSRWRAASGVLSGVFQVCPASRRESTDFGRPPAPAAGPAFHQITINSIGF